VFLLALFVGLILVLEAVYPHSWVLTLRL